MKPQYITRNGKRPIITTSPNSGNNAIRNEKMPDCQYCMVKDPLSPTGVSGLWVRKDNIVRVKEKEATNPS